MQEAQYRELEQMGLTLSELESALEFLADDAPYPPPYLTHLSRRQWGVLTQFLDSLNQEKARVRIH